MASKKKAVEQQLKTAVDWKIFEWQAMLVGADNDDVSEKAMDRCKTWLQPIHFNEVVKERAYDGRCGYPCCDEKIAVPRVDFDSPEEKKYFRINRNAGTVDEANGLDYEKLFYCSKRDEEGRPMCLTKSKIFISTMDSSIPASRAAAMELDLSDKKQVAGSAADVLRALSLATDSAEAYKSKSPSKKGGGGKTANHINGKESRAGDFDSVDAKKMSEGGAEGEDEGEDEKTEEANTEEADRERKEKRKKERDSKRSAEGQPPLYTHRDMTTRGALKPAKWGVRSSGAPVALSSASASAAAEPKSEPETVTRAKQMLQSLKNDPNLRNIHDTPPSKGGPKDKNDTTPDGRTRTSGKAKAAAAAKEPNRTRQASSKEEGAQDKDTGGVATTNTEDGGSGGDSEEGSGTDGVHPSMRATYAPTSQAPALGRASGSDEVAVARQKALEKAAAQKSAILAMKEKYRRSMAGMDVMGGQVQTQAQVMQQPSSPQDPVKVASAAAKTPSPAKQGQGQEQESPWGLAALSPSPEKSLTPGKGAVPGVMNAEGFVDFSWREERLDTSIQQALPRARAQDRLPSAADSKSESEKEKGKAVSPSAAATLPPRVRLNPRGARARELARQAAEKGQTPGETGALRAVVVERGVDAAEAFMAKREVEVAADPERGVEEAGVLPIAEYDVGLQAGKAREVEWREPDAALLATLKTVPERIPQHKPAAGMDPKERKTSLFKQQRREYLDMSAAASSAFNQVQQAQAQAQEQAQAQLPSRGASTASGALSEAKRADGPVSSSRHGGKASAGAKTVSWDITEVANPTTLPEESLADKRDPSDPNAVPEPKDYEAALPSPSSSPSSSAGQGDVNTPGRTPGAGDPLFEEHPSEAPVRINHALRNEFFSREGVSLTFLPKGTEWKLEDVEGEGEGEGEGKDSQRRRAAKTKQVSGRVDLEEAEAKTREKASLDAEGEGEGDEDEDDGESSESPWEDSEDSEAEEDGDDDGELLYGPAAGGGASFFLQVYTLLDDMLSHTGPVLKKKPFPGAAPSKAAAAEGEGDEKSSAKTQQPEDMDGSLAGTDAASEADAKSHGSHDEEEKKLEKVAGRPLSLPPRRRPSAAAGGNKPEDTALGLLSRGMAAAENALELSTVLRGPVLSEYHQCKRRLLEVADAQAPVPALTSTGWTVVGLLCIDGIVRLRRLLFRQQDSRQDSTDGRTADMWADVVSECLGRLQHNRAAKVRCDQDQLRHLKGFFDDLR